MKRYFFFVAVLATIAVILFACEKSDDLKTVEDYQQTEIDDYLSKQRRIINRLKSRTGTTINATKDEILSIAAELDSCKDAFISSHPQLRVEFQKEITEEECACMLFDKDLVLDFVGRSYSTEVLNDVKHFLNGTFVPSNDNGSISLMPSYGNNPIGSLTIDEFIHANLEVAYEFEAMVVDVFVPEGLKDKYKNKSNSCIEKYKSDINQCLVTLDVSLTDWAIGLDWTIILKLTFPNVSSLYDSYRLLEIATEFNQCIRFADNAMDECK